MDASGIISDLSEKISAATGLLLECFLVITFICFAVTGLKSVFGDWKADRRVAGALLLNATAVFILTLKHLLSVSGSRSESLLSLGVSVPMMSSAVCAAGIAASLEYFLVISLGKRWRFRRPCSAVFGLCGTVADSGILGFEHVKEPFLGYRYRYNNRNYIAEPHKRPRLKRSQVGEKILLMIDPVCPEFFLTSAEMKLITLLPVAAGAAGICLLLANLAALRAGA